MHKYYFFLKKDINSIKFKNMRRDIHAANNMIYFYLKYYNAPGTDVSMPVKRVKFSKQILKQESTTSLV